VVTSSLPASENLINSGHGAAVAFGRWRTVLTGMTKIKANRGTDLL
jgi:hypothetical protein